MVRLEIASVPEGFSHIDLTADASDLGADPEVGRLESSISVSLDITRNANDVLLKGTASVTSTLECARCLEEYRQVLESPVELWCILGGSESPLDGARENVLEVPAGAKYVDLGDYLRSELLVLLPLKPLCKPGCLGLCPECGTNLNMGKCSCGGESDDKRWDALKKLK